MPNILTVSNAPTPYNDALFRAVAAQPDVRLRVLYGAATEAHRAWHLDADKGYEYAVLPGTTFGTSAHLNPGIVGAIHAFAPDVAILSGSYAMPTMQLAAATLALGRTPWLYWGEEIAHGPAPLALRATRGLLRRTLRGAGGVLAIGSRARASYARAGVLTSRIADFRYYADTERFALSEAARARVRAERGATLGLPDGACAVLYCGQLIARKGVDTLLRAVAHTPAGPDAPVVVLAGDGPARPDLEALATSLGVGDRVRWLGFQQPEQLPGVFAAADLFVLPSHAEGWGVVVAEAMAAGLPVLASTRVNAAADLVRAGENGDTFVPGDDAALGELIVTLGHDTDRRASMGALARLSVRSESPACAAPRLVQLVQAVRAGLPIATL